MKHHKNKQKSQKRPSKSSSKPRTKLKIDLFGFHAVTAAWQNPQRHIDTLYITNQALKGFEQSAKAKRPPPTIISKEELDRALPSGAVHQGIALATQALEEIDVQDLIIKEEQEDKSILLMLDQVTDPHNVGAILRSACAFGASGMILQRKHAPDLTGTLAKTACGAIEHVPVAYETNLTRALEKLQENGYFVIGLDERGEDIGALPNYKKAVLVLGAEGPGLRRLVREQCDVLARLPMHGPMPSINVSNAAAVALYSLQTRP